MLTFEFFSKACCTLKCHLAQQGEVLITLPRHPFLQGLGSQDYRAVSIVEPCEGMVFRPSGIGEGCQNQ
eukprot:UN15370